MQSYKPSPISIQMHSLDCLAAPVARLCICTQIFSQDFHFGFKIVHMDFWPFFCGKDSRVFRFEVIHLQCLSRFGLLPPDFVSVCIARFLTLFTPVWDCIQCGIFFDTTHEEEARACAAILKHVGGMGLCPHLASLKSQKHFWDLGDNF